LKVFSELEKQARGHQYAFPHNERVKTSRTEVRRSALSKAVAEAWRRHS
jgi:hypothetical protein